MNSDVKTFPLSDDEIGRNELRFLLLQTYAALNLIGEDEAATELRFRGFAWVLEDYPIEVITDAFHEFLKFGKDIPKPAEIIEIIDRNKN